MISCFLFGTDFVVNVCRAPAQEILLFDQEVVLLGSDPQRAVGLGKQNTSCLLLCIYLYFSLFVILCILCLFVYFGQTQHLYDSHVNLAKATLNRPSQICCLGSANVNITCMTKECARILRSHAIHYLVADKRGQH